jgi:dsRNA-specific ribonuclease
VLLLVTLQDSPPDKNEGELSVDKATAIRNVQLAAIAQRPHLSLQQHLHLLPYRSDLYTPTGHLHMDQSSASAPTYNSSSSNGARRAGPIGLLMRPNQGSNSRPIEDEPFETEKAGKRLADCVEALIGAVYLSAAAQEAVAAGAGRVLGDLPVSQAGLAAAAAFCEAAGVLPPGAWMQCVADVSQRHGCVHLPPPDIRT